MPPLIELVNSVRRRWIIRQTIEFTAVGFALGNVLSIALVSIQIALGHAAFSLSIVLPLLGSIFGALTAARSWPSKVKVLERIDRVAGTDDLFSTAWRLLENKNDAPFAQSFDPPLDPWHRSILASAISHAAGIDWTAMSPAILDRRVGKRGWSAIALSACTLTVLSALSMVGAQTIAHATVDPPATSRAQSWTQWMPQKPEPSAASIAASSLEAKAEQMVDSQSAAERNSSVLTSVRTNAKASALHADQDAAGAGESHSRFDARVVADWTIQSEVKTPPSKNRQSSSMGEPRDDGSLRSNVDEIASGEMTTTEQVQSAADTFNTDVEAKEETIPYRMRSTCKNYFSATH